MHRLLSLITVTFCAASPAGAYGQVQDCGPGEPTIAAPIRLITFSNAALVPQEKQQEIAQIYRDKKVSAGSVERDIDSFGEELGERVRAEYQNMGYFKVEVDSRALKTADEHFYDLEAQVRNVGPQYRLGEIRFVHATVFPATQLRDLFRIQREEVFSRVKVAEGLERLRKLYRSQGYINYTPVPGTEFDDSNGVVNLTIESEEGKQFRLRRVDILGANAETQARVGRELPVRPGEVYDADAFERAVSRLQDGNENPARSALRPDLTMDETRGTVDVVLDLGRAAPCAAMGERMARQ